MMLITKAIRRQLVANQVATGDALVNDTAQPDHRPALKLFNPCGSETWLITEIDPDGRMYGLCDLGWGEPELGYVMLSEIEAVDGPLGIGIERDQGFTATKSIGAYAAEARDKGRIAA